MKPEKIQALIQETQQKFKDQFGSINYMQPIEGGDERIITTQMILDFLMYEIQAITKEVNNNITEFTTKHDFTPSEIGKVAYSLQDEYKDMVFQNMLKEVGRSMYDEGFVKVKKVGTQFGAGERIEISLKVFKDNVVTEGRVFKKLKVKHLK